MSERCRNSSRAWMLERWTSIVGTPVAAKAAIGSPSWIAANNPISVAIALAYISGSAVTAPAYRATFTTSSLGVGAHTIIAALAAFEATEELDANVARYKRNRDLLLSRLPQAGFERFASPDGAFYLYADVAHLTNDSEEFCRRMLAEAGVAATPGIDFDPERGRAYLRFSFAGTEADMAEAARRLIAWRK